MNGGAVGAGARRARVAIAHDYLTQRGGAERVVLAMLRAFPDATIHTTLYDPEGTYPEFREARIEVSPLNRIGFFRRHHRAALPLLALASRGVRTDADVVVASSSGWAHGFDHSRSGGVLVYCHNPARWLYQSDTYLGRRAATSPNGLALLALRPFLVHWDKRAAARADVYLANSTVVRERVRAAYGREADVVAPPFGVDPALPASPIDDVADWAGDGFHLVVSRLLPYKNVHHVVDAFRGLPERLLVIGSGPMAQELRARLPDNVRLVSGLTDDQMRWGYARALALIAPSHEDFGLTPLEAGAFGRPTLALHAGGYLDTITPGLNGTFFAEPTAASIRAAVVADRAVTWDPVAIAANVRRFDEPRFHEELRRRVETLLADALLADTRASGEQRRSP